MQVRDEVALRAVQAYHDLVRARTQLELARRNEEARTSIVDLVRQRSDIGGGTQSDVVRAQSRLADATATTASAMQRLGVARAAYRELFSTDSDLPADAPVFDIPLDSGIASQQPQIVEDTWKVRQALAGRAAVEAEMAAVRGRSLPSINLELSATRRDLVGPANPGTDRSVMLVAKQSLYAGGADSARIDAASQKLLQSSEELESARRESARVLDQVLLEAESQERLMESRANTARLAAESLKMVREQYAYRRGTLLDLLTAQESLYAAGRELIDSQLDQAMSRYRVLNAASRLSQFVGTEGRAPTP
jgi:adhesin transport system outer membrane protein